MKLNINKNGGEKMGLKKELDVFREYCKDLETAKELDIKEHEEVLKAVETLKNLAVKIGY